MLRLNKFTKITSIYIITMMMITTIFTYFGYYAHKATIKDDWPTKYVADDINDDLKYNAELPLLFQKLLLLVL